MGLFGRKKDKKQAADAAAAPAAEGAPAAPAAAPAAEAAPQGGDMFSGMNNAPTQGGDMFGGMNSAPAQSGDMFSGMNSGAGAPAPTPAPAPAPAPAQPQAQAQAADPLMGARQKLMQISNQLRSEVVRLNEGERKMREYIQGLDNTINNLENQLVEAEAGEAAAIAVEDYAKAEEIAGRSTALKNEINAKRAEIAQCMQRNGQATQLRVSKIQTELVTIDAMIKSFDTAYTHVNNQFIAYVKQLDDQAAAHDARLAQMMEKIQEKEDILAKNREEIAAEKEEVEKLVHADCTELYKEKEEASMLKFALDQDIADLKEQLHQKNQELLACTKRIADADQKIQQVRVKFLPQFQPIEDKNKALGTKVKEIETMKSQYATASSRVEMVKKSAEEDKKQKKEIVDTRKDELDVITCLAEALKNYDQKINDRFQDLMTKQATMFNMKKDLAENSIHSKGIVNRMQVLEKTISDNNAVVEETATKLPQLEQQKADAVASKNYKVAGQVTSQIKQLQAKKEAASMTMTSAEEELNGIKASSAEELAALDAKRSQFDFANKDYQGTYYDILKYNAIVCRNASRRIEAITRGDDIFRFACQSLVGSLFDITKTDLEEMAKEAGLPALTDDDDLPSATPETAEAPAAPAAAPADDLFNMDEAPKVAAAPVDDMFNMDEAPKAASGELTKERALELAAIAEAQKEDIDTKLDSAMNEEKYDECDALSAKSDALENYASELKKFANGEAEAPTAPDCFDVNFAVKASAGEDLFAGM